MNMTAKKLKRSPLRALPALCAGATLALLGLGAQADESVIRKTLGERIPQLAKIDEVRATPMPGLFEVRVGTDLFYTDAKGSYVIQGELIDTKARRNLTEDRINQLTAVKFEDLPFKDAFTLVRGDGSRKIAVFEDPNCGYCKRLAKDMQSLKDATIYTFLYPILSPDSTEKSKNIWCAKDRATAWNDWMTAGKAPAAAAAGCDTSAIDKNVALGQKMKVSGTPTIFTADGNRLPGAVPLAQLDQAMNQAAGK